VYALQWTYNPLICGRFKQRERHTVFFVPIFDLCKMTERFYLIDHLSTDQLRELYSTYREQGWIDMDIDSDYYEVFSGVKPPNLSEQEILMNINAGDKHNYFVFMHDHENEQDGIMIGFGLYSYQYFSVYLHLPPELLEVIVSKYCLYCSHEGGKYYDFFYHEKRKLE
jgi:hypothetical protein